MAEKTSPIRSDNPFQKALSMAGQSDAPGTRRRTFLTAAAAAALGPTAAALLGGPLASMASAASSSNLPDFAPVPVACVDDDDPRQTARYSFGEMPIRRWNAARTEAGAPSPVRRPTSPTAP